MPGTGRDGDDVHRLNITKMRCAPTLEFGSETTGITVHLIPLEKVQSSKLARVTGCLGRYRRDRSIDIDAVAMIAVSWQSRLSRWLPSQPKVPCGRECSEHQKREYRELLHCDQNGESTRRRTWTLVSVCR